MKKSFIDVSWATQLTFKVNNRNIRKRYAIYLKLAPLSNVSIVKFEQVNVSWGNRSLSDAGLKPISPWATNKVDIYRIRYWKSLLFLSLSANNSKFSDNNFWWNSKLKKTHSLTKIKDKRINILLIINTQYGKGSGKVTINLWERESRGYKNFNSDNRQNYPCSFSW